MKNTEVVREPVIVFAIGEERVAFRPLLPELSKLVSSKIQDFLQIAFGQYKLRFEMIYNRGQFHDPR